MAGISGGGTTSKKIEIIVYKDSRLKNCSTVIKVNVRVVDTEHI